MSEFEEVGLQPEEEATAEALAPDEVTLAEGTEYERIIKLRVPRGKQYRERHRKLLSTFAQLESVASAMAGDSGRVGPIVEAIEKLFGQKDFEDVMIPFALGMESQDDRDYLDNLLPMEKFMAYMSAATFIVSGGNAESVRAALKK